MKNSNRFYVYVLFRPEDGSPIYVGKGQGARYRKYRQKLADRPDTNIGNYARSMIAAGKEIPCVLVAEGLSEPVAFEYETAWIKALGRKPNGPLLNMTDGGEGISGMDPEKHATRVANNVAGWTPEKRAAVRERVLQRWATRTDAERLAIAQAIAAGKTGKTGRVHSAETRRKMSESHKRRFVGVSS